MFSNEIKLASLIGGETDTKCPISKSGYNVKNKKQKKDDGKALTDV